MTSHLVDEDVAEMEECMTDYCLMLPKYTRGKFQCMFGFVFSDWDTFDIGGRKCLPDICRMCFANNVIR